VIRVHTKEIPGVATRVLKAPSEADVNRVVGDIRDIVVENSGAKNIGAQNRCVVAIVFADELNLIAAYDELPVRLSEIARMMCLGLHSTSFNSTACAIREQIRLDSNVPRR